MKFKTSLLLAPGAVDPTGGKQPDELAMLRQQLEALTAENAELKKNPVPGQIAELRLQLSALKAENDDLKKITELEPAIKEKLAAGLTREQAESVIKQQKDTDAFLAKLEADQEKARKAAARR